MNVNMLSANYRLSSLRDIVSIGRSFFVNTIYRCKHKDVELPKPGQGRSFRRVVHYPKKYTVQPLPYTRLGGRDPETGRLVVKGIGGGIKFPYHWVDNKRLHPEDPSFPLVEKVIEVWRDWCRTANIALVVGNNKMRYILATENMKPGDVIKTSSEIPRIPVRPNEGDAHPLGALPQGTQINNVEKVPGKGGYYAQGAGTYAVVLRRSGDRVIVQLPSKHEVALQKECMAVVGRLSNIMHNKTHIGSAQRNRELGNRPRSGLWQRKDGRFGRKIRPLPPLKVIKPKPDPPSELTLSM